MITRDEIKEMIERVKQFNCNISREAHELMNMVDAKLNKIESVVTDGSIDADYFRLILELQSAREFLWKIIIS